MRTEYGLGNEWPSQQAQGTGHLGIHSIIFLLPSVYEGGGGEALGGIDRGFNGLDTATSIG